MKEEKNVTSSKETSKKASNNHNTEVKPQDKKQEVKIDTVVVKEKKEKKPFSKENYTKKELLVVMLFVMIISTSLTIITFLIFNRIKDDNKILNNINDNINVEIVEKDFEDFFRVYNTIVKSYYKEVDKSKLIASAIEGMINSLEDPYSIYFTPEETESFTDRMVGNYAGIGCEIATDITGDIIITNVFEDSPAKEAGLIPNDRILKINGEDVVKSDTSDAVSHIKGEIDTTVTLLIKRNDEEIEIVVTRRNIVLKTVTSKVIAENNKKIGYIKMDLFAANSYEQFKSELEKIEKENIDNLIIDVRNNSGGYLDIVTDISELFLEKDKLIYNIKSQDKITGYKDKTKESRNYDIVVLINEYSASASEILAGALDESHANTITMGTTSYGKGTVQTASQLHNNDMFKLTTQEWLTPNQNFINEIGIIPEIEVILNEEYYNNPILENDNQLQEAIKYLAK